MRSLGREAYREEISYQERERIANHPEQLVRKLCVPAGGLCRFAHRGVQIVQRPIAVLSSIKIGSTRGFEARNRGQQGGFGFDVLTHMKLAYANRQLRTGDDPGSRRV